MATGDCVYDDETKSSLLFSANSRVILPKAKERRVYYIHTCTHYLFNIHDGLFRKAQSHARARENRRSSSV